MTVGGRADRLGDVSLLSTWKDMLERTINFSASINMDASTACVAVNIVNKSSFNPLIIVPRRIM